MEQESAGSRHDLEAGGPIAPGNSPRAPVVSRRSLLRGGAAATPVLLTLASNPVSAGGSYNCVIASSFVSATTFKSRNGGSTAVNCTTNGNRCEYWQSNANSGSCDNHLLQTVASYLGVAGPFSGKTCQYVMQMSIDTTGPTGVAQHLISLMLNYDNSGANFDTTFSKTYLKGIWSNFCSNNYTYLPASGGAAWTPTMVINWLRVMLGYTTL